MKHRSRRRIIQTRFPGKAEKGTRDPWLEYVVREHGCGTGLKAVYMDPLFDKVIQEVGPISHLNAGMMPTDIALLRGLAKRYPGCTFFEIGKRRSESLANLSDVTSECYALNRPAGDTRRKGLRHKYMFMMGNYTSPRENAVILNGDSRFFDFSGLRKRFDLIFINSGITYDRVLTDTRKAFEYLAHEKSTIVWHNYICFPEQIRYEVLAGILDGTDPLEREQLFFVPRTKCAILMRDKSEEFGSR